MGSRRGAAPERPRLEDFPSPVPSGQTVIVSRALPIGRAAEPAAGSATSKQQTHEQQRSHPDKA